MNDVRWIVQTNLGDGADAKRIMMECMRLGIEAISAEPIPFDTKLPVIPKSDKIDVFYGSTNFIKNAYGIHPNFNVDAYSEHYGDEFLNNDGYVDSMAVVKLFVAANKNKDYDFFIRPVEDIKEFPGMHTNAEKFLEWASRLTDDCTVNDNTRVMISEPKTINKEWRLFIVDGKVCTGSLYRVGGRGMFIDYLPPAVVEYAERMCKIWTPDDIFVMDIAETNIGSFYSIIECNGWNSCGLYKSSVPTLVETVSNFLGSRDEL